MQKREVAAYERLRVEIVKSAVMDLRKALRKSDKLGVVCKEQIALECWFMSKWGQLLSGDNGAYIIEKCHRDYKATANKKGKQKIADDVQKRIYQEYKSGARNKDITKKYGINNSTLYFIVGRWER